MLVIDDTPRRARFISPTCSTCVHLRLVTTPSCDAYTEPDSIPEEIWNGDNDHREPFPGDHNIHYEHFAEALSKQA